MHSYQLLQTGEVIPRHDLGLRDVRNKGYFPSVTTKLKFPSSDFLDRWRMERAIDYTIDHPKLQSESLKDYYDRIDRLIWQPRKRWDGVEFDSNDFGTFCHNEIDKWHKDQSYQFEHAWEMYVCGWPVRFGQIFSEVVAAETMVACKHLKTAGTIDLLALEQSGRVAFCDFKMRPHKGDAAKRVRDKDCQQLAIEADIYRRQNGLDYMPNCYSAIGCPDTGEWWVKQWSDKMVAKHLSIALAVNLAYNVANDIQSLSAATEATQMVLAGEA